MELIMAAFAPFVLLLTGPIGINQALREFVDKLYDGLDTFLDNIGLDN